MNESALSCRASRGLSLIELLLAVALGGILMGGAISLFVNNRATYEVTNDMARMQENARFALQLITEDLRMAGYVGCVDDFTKVTDHVTGVLPGVTEGHLASFAHAIEGFESNAANWLPSGYVGGVPYRPDSDAITVRYMDGDRTATAGAVNNEVINDTALDPDAPVILIRDLTYTVETGQLFNVSDCGGSDIFTVESTGVDGATGADFIAADRLARSYEAFTRALVAPAVGVRYFVQDNAAGVPSLFRSRLNRLDPSVEDAEELVDGVQSMQILYGVDSDQDGLPNAFISAGASVADPADPTRTVELLDRNDFLSVVAVKIAFLMATVDEFGDVPDDVVYDVGNERFCRTGLVAVPACTRTFAPDRRRRRVFQTTVAVRNFQ